MIGRLRAYLQRRREVRRRARKRQKKFRRWLALNPGGSYGQFYALSTRRNIDAGVLHPTLGVTNVKRSQVEARAQRILADFKRAGCAPHHVVVDYGCGSLWVGEAFMGYLEPGGYVGLDLVDMFYTEGLARLPPEFLASRKPSLHVIDDSSLRETRDRNPDFILSLAVMQHVPPDDLAGYFARIVSLAGPRTRIEIGNQVMFCTWGRSPHKYWHTRWSVRSALAPLGYVADYRPESRIMRTTPGFSLVRR
jgi:hypothetical protein